MVEFDEFFEFGTKKPINRLAYTEEDLKYKTKVIQKMQELGMEVTVDKVGNICGSIKFGNGEGKTIVMGSHTDSVYDGGQYDGTVGVIAALKIVENLLRSGKKFNGCLKVPIYACEESSRFGNACIGSKYLNGNLTEEDFEKIKDQKKLKEGKTVTLKEAIEFEKAYLREHTEGVQEVEKIFTEDEIDDSFEAHIEQYNLLNKKYKQSGKKPTLGIVTGIGSAVRLKYSVEAEGGHTGSTPMKKRSNAVDGASYIAKKIRKLGKSYEEEGLGRASQVELNTKDHHGSFNQLAKTAEGLIDVRLLGDNTPEKVLEDFKKIVQKAERKTKTKITTQTVSMGTPVKTDPKLNEEIASSCKKKGIQYHLMPSYAGHDTGYVPAKRKTLLFCPSTGGSHNCKESTKRKFIELACDVLTDVVENLLLEKWKNTISQAANDPGKGGEMISEKKDSNLKSAEEKEVHTH